MGRVFVQEMPAGSDLLFIELHKEGEVDSGLYQLTFMTLGGVFGVELLPRAPGSAHHGAYEKQRLLVAEQLAGSFALLGQVEAPGLPILRIRACEV